MIKIAHVRELTELAGLPVEVIDVIREAVTILDGEYGEHREIDNGYGGYVLVIENERELKCLQGLNIDLETEFPEYIDKIVCADGQIFANVLFLQGSDFGIVIILPWVLLNENLRRYAV